jgi:AraC-like DNA-binding protein
MVVVVTELGGCSGLKSRGVVEEAQPSKLFVFNPAEPHSAWMGASRRWRYRSLYLTSPGLSELAEALGLTEVPYFTRNTFVDADLIAAFHALHDQTDDFRARERLIAAFGALFARYGGHGPRLALAHHCRTDLGRAMQVIRAHHTEALHLSDVASAVGLNSFQLIGMFRQSVGLTPHAFLIQVRLETACRHLRRGRSLADAAAEAGFYDQSAMHRHFKRHYGITPRQFARAAQA